MPTVSVILLTCNRPEWLRDAVASVVAQTWEDWQCVIFCNGGTLAGNRLLDLNLDEQKFSLRRSWESTIGYARNAAVQSVWTPYYLFLDDDDVLCPDALETLLRPLAARPHISGAYGFPYLMNESGERMCGPVGKRGKGGELHLSDLASNLNMVSPPGCALIRRSAFEAAGGWDETGEVRESVEIFQRLLRVGPMACVPREVLGYRQHSDQLSKKRNLMTEQYAATEKRLQSLLNEVA